MKLFLIFLFSVLVLPGCSNYFVEYNTALKERNIVLKAHQIATRANESLQKINSDLHQSYISIAPYRALEAVKITTAFANSFFGCKKTVLNIGFPFFMGNDSLPRERFNRVRINFLEICNPTLRTLNYLVFKTYKDVLREDSLIEWSSKLGTIQSDSTIVKAYNWSFKPVFFHLKGGKIVGMITGPRDGS
jgi:hypothetical protein